jgi:hypothetical protein
LTATARTRKLGKIANHRQEPRKAPLPLFIERLYRKRFGRERPVHQLAAITRFQWVSGVEHAVQQRVTARRGGCSTPSPRRTHQEPTQVVGILDFGQFLEGRVRVHLDPHRFNLRRSRPPGEGIDLLDRVLERRREHTMALASDHRPIPRR